MCLVWFGLVVLFVWLNFFFAFRKKTEVISLIMNKSSSKQPLVHYNMKSGRTYSANRKMFICLRIFAMYNFFLHPSGPHWVAAFMGK